MSKKGRPLLCTPGEYQIKDNAKLRFSPINLVFSVENEKIGEFRYDVKAGEWTFLGDADKAALQFARFLSEHFKELIWEKEDEIF